MSAAPLGVGSSSSSDASARSRTIVVAEVAGVAAVAGMIHMGYKVLRSYLKARRMHKMLEEVPFADYEGTNTFAGFTPQLVKNRRRVHDWLNEATAGKPVSKLIGIGLEPSQVWLVVRDPLIIRHFLKDSFSKYSKADLNENIFFWFLYQWIGGGIFTMTHGIASDDGGQEWMMQRKIASNIFSRANFMNNMGEVFSEKADRFVDLLVGPAGRGGVVDLQALFFGFTMDSIMRIFFGESANTMGGEDCAYATAFDLAHRSMMEYVRTALKHLTLLKFLPWPLGGHGGLAWKAYGSRSPAYRDFHRALRTLTAEAERVVNEARSDPGLAQRKDLLALFLQASEKENFSNEYMRDMTLSFVIAGRDTTACLLSWMFFAISTSPEVQSKLQHEIDEKMPPGTEPTLKNLTASSMPYLNGVIYETLRLYPPVPGDNKIAYADDVLPNGLTVPKGTILQFLPYAMGRDPAVWPEPLSFRPDRWIPFKAPSPHEFPVFQAGPRICLGMDMAVFEAKLLAVKLLQRFDFSLKAGEQENIHYSSTITMSLCNSKQQDSHNLWAIPRLRKGDKL